MSKKPFREVVIQVKILCDDPTLNFDGMPLENIGREIENGGCSGEISIISQRNISGKEMAKLAEAQGTDPGFFMLDHNGRSIN